MSTSQPLSNYLPGFASLLDTIDKRVLVLLRDGRSLFGILRSIDQFANLVLHLTVERIYIGNQYGEIDRGVFLIRGENVVLCGEVDEDVDVDIPGYTKVPVEVILANQAREAEEKSQMDKLKVEALQERGMLLQADALADDL